MNNYKIDTHFYKPQHGEDGDWVSYINWNLLGYRNHCPNNPQVMSPYKVGHFIWYELKNMIWAEKYGYELKKICAEAEKYSFVDSWNGGKLKMKWNEMW